MKNSKNIIAAITLASASIVSASHSSSLDSDGCWDGQTQYGDTCLSTSSEWSKSRTSTDRLIVSITNRCSYRVYARFCNQRYNNGPDCGASGIAAGYTKKWSTAFATGRHRSKAIGSDVSSKDWVCAGKARGWRNSMF
ncbi:MAG: hypothetical protein ABJ063_13765 [Marinomonas sp.]|uniref:hypothetical protein n=1 Tax=Alphaproteobacteria TaxID=28211 RepID=UPI0032679CD2